MFFAAKEASVIKSVLIIALIFVFLELKVLLDPSFELALEGLIPLGKNLAAFEKVEFVRVLFHFFMQASVGLARVFIDAEKKFEKDDKVNFLKTMKEQSKTINTMILNWDSRDYLKEKEEKPPKKNRC